MAKRVVFVQGSPRLNGNTRTASGIARQALHEHGVESSEIVAVKLDFKHPGCISCHKCQQSDQFGCHIDDELGRAVATLPDYDAVVIATPLYWFSFSAQVKMFIDRMYSLIKFDGGGVRTPLSGKPMGLLATAGGGIEFNLDLLEMQWKTPAHIAGCPFVSCLIPFARYEPGELVGDGEAVDRAKAFGEKLAKMLGG